MAKDTAQQTIPLTFSIAPGSAGRFFGSSRGGRLSKQPYFRHSVFSLKNP
jgi:hypothetical protein